MKRTRLSLRGKRYLLTSFIFPMLVSCGGNDTTIQAATLKGLTLSGSYKTTFTVNETFTYSGLVVTANYSDNSSKIVSNYTVIAPNMATEGTKSVQVKYTEGSITCTANYAITVSNAPAVSLTYISLGGDPKTSFTVNETFTYDGLIVNAHYSDGSSRSVGGYQVTPPNMSSAGTKTVSVTYSENGVSRSASYNITVSSAPITLSSITLSGSYKTSFIVNETFVYNGLVVTAHYSNNSSKTVTPTSVTTPDMSTTGSKTVTVTYTEGGVSRNASYTISVTQPQTVTLSSISLSGTYKTTYNVGDTFNCTGLVVTAHYSNNTSKTVDGYYTSTPDMSSAGSKTVTVYYSENMVTVNTTYTITVNQAISSLDPRSEPHFGKQYYLNHIGDIHSVWNTYRGKGITVAVIDVGFYASHEDFTFEDGNSKISSLSGYIKTTGSSTSMQVGKQYLGGDEDHGTFCAGVVGAGLNGKGVVGIAPECNLLLLKTDAKPASINYAFRYAADNGAKVITISIGSYNDGGGDLDTGGTPIYSAFDDAVAYARNKGTVVVSAGGNGGPTEGNRPTEYTYPGATTGVIGVGGLAANSSKDIWSGSSYNSSRNYRFCDVFAPAQGMYGMCSYNSSKYDGDWKGTSFASPIVAGIAALYFEKYPTNTVTQFESALYSACMSMGDDDLYGYGAVDVARTLGVSSPSSTITVKVKTNWTNCYAFVWNTRSETGPANWPGTKINKGTDGYFSYTVNPSVYDSIIFNNGSGVQSCDLIVTSLYGKNYDLTNLTSETQNGSTFYLGKYI